MPVLGHEFVAKGGFGKWFYNGTGAASVKGTVVSLSTSADSTVVAQADQYDAIGVIYHSGVAAGGLVGVIMSGSAEVLFEDGETPTKGYWVYCATTDGRAANLSDPPGAGIPEHDEHFKELGHCEEGKASGTSVLARCVIHPN